MLDKYLNPTPSVYKWDRFAVGFFPGLLLPFVMFMVFFCFTWFNAVCLHSGSFSAQLFLLSVSSPVTFMRITTLCCIPNGLLFFLFIHKNYYNAARAVVLVTMLYVIAIVAKDML
jgi:hypothetical protein